MKIISCSVSPELAEELEARAARAGKSLNQFLRIILEAWSEKVRLPLAKPEESRMGKARSGGWDWL